MTATRFTFFRFISRSTLNSPSVDESAWSTARSPMLSAIPPSINCRYGWAPPDVLAQLESGPISALIDRVVPERVGHPLGLLVAARSGVIPKRDRSQEHWKRRRGGHGSTDRQGLQIRADRIEALLSEV